MTTTEATLTKSDMGLRGLNVVDLGVGMAAALVAKFLREGGAEITRFEPPGGDPFYEVYPAYEVWRRDSTIVRGNDGEQRLETLLQNADVCLVGGEDYPGVARREDATELQSKHPRLIVLDIEGYPAGTRHAGRPATDVLVQARSGLAFEHYVSRPLLMSFEPANYGAALHGLAGIFAALLRRESSDTGQVVATSLFEGALTWTMQLWCEVEKPTPAANFVIPKDPWPLIFRCADGVWIQVVLGSAGSKGRLYRILKIDDPTVDINDSGMPKPTADGKNFFGDIDVLARHVANFKSTELLEAIWAAGLPAEPVLAPGACWDDPQVEHNRVIVREPDGVRHVGSPGVRRVFSRAAQRCPTPRFGSLGRRQGRRFRHLCGGALYLHAVDRSGGRRHQGRVVGRRSQSQRVSLVHLRQPRQARHLGRSQAAAGPGDSAQALRRCRCGDEQFPSRGIGAARY